ncbi:MAG: HDOD domain-containing protein [Deltaproteobacteria bacterium]|nr:HDOD domain-containing protein [Deltaproteobacteria bacterium]
MDRNGEEQKIALILSDIAEKIFNEVSLGFDPEVFDVLDNLDSTEQQIEFLKVKIGEDILARLFGIANSVYFGQLKRGKVDTFYEVITRLGMDLTKLIIIFMSMAALSKDEEVKIIFARSFATSILASKLIANECGLTYEDTKKVEIGGLLLEIGKIMIVVYRSLYPDDYKQAGIDESFVTEHHTTLGLMFIEKYNFSENLKDIISAKYLTLGQKLVKLSSIVLIAHTLVDHSFRNFHNKLIIASPLPDPDGNITYTTGWAIESMFKAVGLSKHIKLLNPSQTNQK